MDLANAGADSVTKRGRFKQACHKADKRTLLQSSSACTPTLLAADAMLDERNSETEEDNYFTEDDEVSSDRGERSDNDSGQHLFGVEQCLPVKILALGHVVSHIYELLMASSEAVVAAAQAGRIEWLEKLLDEYDCDVSEAAVSTAAANGQIEALKVLLPEVDGDYDGEVADAITVAAVKGHLDDVQFLLPWVDDDEKRNDAAWEVLEEASAHGHYDTVEIAAQQAKEAMGNIKTNSTGI
ncbi:hypothetical protein PHYSODRAFT_301142 [Phytophthora sojae]|uniref:Uncharacterized protein n=1 Tax=Phytophthora sojae (strain P6497) TaxID=1094619 RepID=G4ZF69_PHYSP|nr:hypothetical protein PHYSODRAFT_301142 [Phytophthora sojae]EGZ18500.1 hypothetical protein PHYSODRAFT_301142 [Phytophthora sojae]|eukprot:XP_009527558.1 hypothetical protein PHYSODRAFT_301142 [Phytophthora sojae]